MNPFRFLRNPFARPAAERPKAQRPVGKRPEPPQRPSLSQFGDEPVALPEPPDELGLEFPVADFGPDVTTGAFGLSHPETEREPGERHETFSQDMLEEFLRGELVLLVQSSNVASLGPYRAREHTLDVTFKGKGTHPPSTYRYYEMTTEDARYFAQANSKGGAIWTIARVPGKGNAHLTRKPYQRLN